MGTLYPRRLATEQASVLWQQGQAWGSWRLFQAGVWLSLTKVNWSDCPQRASTGSCFLFVCLFYETPAQSRVVHLSLKIFVGVISRGCTPLYSKAQIPLWHFHMRMIM